MNASNPHTLGWIRLGAFAGIATCVVYPTLIFVPLPVAGAAALAGAWGPLLAIASMGLARLLEIERRSIAAEIAAALNALAGTLVTAMLMVQIAVGERAKGSKPSAEIVGVWLGLDVAWDVYVGAGTALFAIAMWRHPRFGPALAIPGLVVALGLLALNLATFPTPPGEAGLFDAGPIVGLWYLIVSLRVLQSLGWVRTTLGEAGATRA